MASLKDLRLRIASVKSTQKITKAMKMVAASKLRRAQEAAEAGRPYAERLGRVLGALSAAMANDDSAPKLLAGSGRDDTYLVIVATADRGLCGGFNTNIARGARRRIEALRAAGKKVKILAVGRKGAANLRRDYAAMIVDTIEIGNKPAKFDLAAEIGARVLAMFEAGEFDVAVLFYAHFKSVLTQVVTEQPLIPAKFEGEGELAAADGAIYEFEPSEEEILESLLPRNVSVQIFRALLENAASEQGARMTAMDNATRNAGEMIDKLTLVYNRTRQATITKELIEIISGAEAI